MPKSKCKHTKKKKKVLYVVQLPIIKLSFNLSRSAPFSILGEGTLALNYWRWKRRRTVEYAKTRAIVESPWINSRLCGRRRITEKTKSSTVLERCTPSGWKERSRRLTMSAYLKRLLTVWMFVRECETQAPHSFHSNCIAVRANSRISRVDRLIGCRSMSLSAKLSVEFA